MPHLAWRILLTGVAVFAWPYAFALGQEAATTVNVVHVLGLENIKRDAKGKLILQARKMRFESGASGAEVGIASIEDVFTGQDSKRLVGGTLGTVSTGRL